MRIELLCTEYKGLTERQEIELFQRVQLGKPLSQAEAFRATQGSWQAFAKLYERDFADVMNCGLQHAVLGMGRVGTNFISSGQTETGFWISTNHDQFHADL